MGIPFDSFGVMIDCSRNAVMNKAAFCKMTDILSALGYNTIRLYTEDTYEVDGEPYFGYLRGRYSKQELKEMDAYCAERGITLVPCIQTLAHLGTIFRYADYGAIRDADDILLVGAERTYALIENMFRSLAECFRARRVNIGMDEAFLLGRGKYLTQNGLVPSAVIMRRHLERVLAIAKKYGFSCEMWGDMFLHAAYGDGRNDAAAVREQVPEDVTLICWDYYHTDEEFFLGEIDKYKALSDRVMFAGGAWTWLGFCPNNSYSIKEIEAAIRACVARGMRDVFFTLWGDNGGECSPFAVLPSLVCAAEFARGNFSMPSVKQRFAEVVGEDFDLFCALELPDKIYAGEEPDCQDPSKVLLYTDPFMGIYDRCVREGTAEAYYTGVSETLRKGETGEWAYLFRPIRALADVLAVKFELGVQTRRAYAAKDRAALARLTGERYPLLLQRLETFYDEYERFWMTEKKPQGFEVQDARLGGLIRRVKHCMDRLNARLSGGIGSIPELEEELLLPFGQKEGCPIAYNYYNCLYTVNVT